MISTCLISLSTFRQADSDSERISVLAGISLELPHHKAFSIHLLTKACFKNRQDLDSERVQVCGGISLELPLPEGFQFALTSLSLLLIIITVYEQPHIIIIILIINSYKQLVNIYPTMCLLKNAYKKFNLQVYAEHVELVTVSKNIVTRIIQ